MHDQMNKRFQTNDLIGEYRVTSFLGEGGMGEVYLGVHEKLGRKAAIKILGAASSDESFKTRFFNEARLQASLHHPNIATLYDFKEQDEQLLIFMEFVDGESLDEIIERRSFTIAETLAVFRSICDAVAYIHKNGIIHRDLKSQNVKVNSAGSVKLLDFGIAKDGSSHGLTQAGGVIGTPNYLSPEQLEGKEATAQADIWALGVLLYEMLTGTLPFKGDSFAQLALGITMAKFTPPEDLNSAVPREVSNVVKKCLKREGTGRFQSVDELIDAVQAASGKGQANTPTVSSTLKQSFGFGAFAKVTPNGTQQSTDASDTSDNETAAIAGKNSGSPTVYIVAGAGVVFVLMIGMVGLGVWAMSGNADAAKASVPTERQSTNGASPSSSSLKSATQRVRVDIDEGKAQVIKNGQPIGTTPLDVDVATGDTPSLTLRRDGFEDKTVQLDVGGGKKVFTFSLKSKN